MTEPRDAIIKAENISAGYDGKNVISGLSFSLGRGEVLAIVGPNGTGKTTVLKAVLGLIPIRGGSLEVFGTDRLAGRRAEKLIAYIPQRMELDRTFPISLKEMLDLSLEDAEVRKYVEILELGHILDRRVGDLSGGQFQRALLAYAIIKEPELLVMDEPTSWVDVRGADCILCIMEQFREKGTSMIMVTHDFTALGDMATHVLGMGHEGYFTEKADSPDLQEKITALFGTAHHGVAGHCRRISPI